MTYRKRGLNVLFYSIYKYKIDYHYTINPTILQLDNQTGKTFAEQLFFFFFLLDSPSNNNNSEASAASLEPVCSGLWGL